MNAVNMEINYAEIKRLAEARELVDREQGKFTRFEDNSDAEKGIHLSGDNHSAVYFPSGLIALPTNGHTHTTESTYQVGIWPKGVGWSATLAPRKEYISVLGHDKVQRYYLMPSHRIAYYDSKDKSELLFQPHPELNYVPVTPLQDYHISISRKQKMDAMKRWQPFFDYAETMWDMVQAGVTPDVDLLQKPLSISRKDIQYAHMQSAKNRNNIYTSGKQLLREQVEQRVLQDDLPYNVALVPNTRTSHSAHWSWHLLDQLRKLGRLENLPVWQG